MYLDINQNAVWNLVSDMQGVVERNMKLDLISKLGARFLKDGDQCCWIFGEMPEHYIAGFGDTPEKAMNDFWTNFHKQT